jgi:hypothetical protein
MLTIYPENGGNIHVATKLSAAPEKTHFLSLSRVWRLNEDGKAVYLVSGKVTRISIEIDTP